MNVTSKAPVRRFRCPHCKTVFHIQRNNNGHYVRYMPPAYCPGCGSSTEKKTEVG